MKYQFLFSLKNNEKIFKTVIDLLSYALLIGSLSVKIVKLQILYVHEKKI